MKKSDRIRHILAAVIILLPLAAGLILWDRLPEKMAIHWNMHNEPDGWASRTTAVVFTPLVFLALHGLYQLLSRREGAKRAKSRAAAAVAFWLVPVLSVLCGTLTIGNAIVPDFRSVRFLPVILGLLFLIVGNYLPKFTRSRTTGIRIKWTLESEDNWFATHRFAGRVWMICGVLILLCVFLPESILPFVMIPLLIPVVVLPFIYSWYFSRKEKK